MRARGELNPLGAVRMCQQVDPFAFLTHHSDPDGHGSRIALMLSNALTLGLIAKHKRVIQSQGVKV